MHTVSTPIALTVVNCRVAAETFALAATSVRDTLEHGAVTRVPGAPAAFDGLVPWRGQLVPVLNVARRLGVAALEADGAIVIAELAGELVGLRVDGVDELAVPFEPATMHMVDLAELVAVPTNNEASAVGAGRGCERA
jgi:purine-binding chemotaxis protein CheW